MNFDLIKRTIENNWPPLDLYRKKTIKQLSDGLSEIILFDFRIIFFLDNKNNKIYFLTAFKKKSQKTPTKEIDRALIRMKEIKNKK